jgi:hypothetical protein
MVNNALFADVPSLLGLDVCHGGCSVYRGLTVVFPDVHHLIAPSFGSGDYPS